MANISLPTQQRLPPDHKILWEKINNFQFDEPGIELPFSQRLVAENSWTQEHTSQVIHEYKKFLLLCCISPGVTPSGDVDQAWHMHLTYTRSYWTDLCHNTLQKEIHHTPTRGGEQEAEKYKHAYQDTLALYQKSFGVKPPLAIWPAGENRFSQSQYRRVDRAKYWLVKKPFTLNRVQGAVAFFSMLTLIFILPSFWFPDFWPFSLFFGLPTFLETLRFLIFGEDCFVSEEDRKNGYCPYSDHPGCGCG